MNESSSKPFSASVDLSEVEHYAALANTWWDTEGPFWPLHRLNALRSRYLREHLALAFDRDPAAPQPLEGLSLLDVGCGGGLLSEAMAALGAEVHGIDVVAGNIRTARFHARSQPWSIDYETTSVEALAEAGARYDIVLTMEVVEHVADLEGFVDACTQVVKPRGVIGVATINRTWRAWLFAIIGAEYVLGWLPRGTHQWHRFVTPRRLAELLGRAGLSIFDECGVQVNPLTRRFSTTRSLGVNYMVLARTVPSMPIRHGV